MRPLIHSMFGLRAAVVCAALAIGAPAIFAHGTGAEHEAPVQQDAAAANREAVDVTLHDLELLNQDDERVKFASDVLGDKLVAVTFFYSSCTTTCPITNAIFAQLQSRLGERLGREVQLVSLTVDPVTDTPRRLASFSAKFQRKPGWTWLTGEKQDVDRVLEGLGAYSPDYSLHPVMVMVGDPRSRRWSRLFGFPKPEAIVAKLDELEAARTRASLSTDKEQ